jgi:hypothetical protein
MVQQALAPIRIGRKGRAPPSALRSFASGCLSACKHPLSLVTLYCSQWGRPQRASFRKLPSCKRISGRVCGKSPWWSRGLYRKPAFGSCRRSLTPDPSHPPTPFAAFSRESSSYLQSITAALPGPPLPSMVISNWHAARSRQFPPSRQNDETNPWRSETRRNHWPYRSANEPTKSPIEPNLSAAPQWS